METARNATCLPNVGLRQKRVHEFIRATYDVAQDTQHGRDMDFVIRTGRHDQVLRKHREKLLLKEVRHLHEPNTAIDRRVR